MPEQHAPVPYVVVLSN